MRQSLPMQSSTGSSTGSDGDVRQTSYCGTMLAMFALSGTVNVDEMHRGYVL